MPRTRPPYPPEFKAEAVQLARNSEKSLSALAVELCQADADGGRAAPVPLTTDEREELRRLRRENQVLQQERAILKKAAACFAKETA